MSVLIPLTLISNEKKIVIRVYAQRHISYLMFDGHLLIRPRPVFSLFSRNILKIEFSPEKFLVERSRNISLISFQKTKTVGMTASR